MSKTNFSDEFRRVAVERVLSGESPPKVAKAVGVSAWSIRKWVREAELVSHERTPTESELLELKRLRKQVADLREDNEILKKATALFAQQRK